MRRVRGAGRGRGVWAVVVCLLVPVVLAEPVVAQSAGEELWDAPLLCDGDVIDFNADQDNDRDWFFTLGRPGDLVWVEVTVSGDDEKTGWFNVAVEDISDFDGDNYRLAGGGNSTPGEYVEMEVPELVADRVVDPDSGGVLHVIRGKVGRNTNGSGVGTIRMRVDGSVLGGVMCKAVQLLLGDAPSHGMAGDPVNTFSGNLFDGHVDLGARPGSAGPVADRSYNSQGGRPGILGAGWKLSYESRLVPLVTEHPSAPGTRAPAELSDVSFWEPSGRTVRFENMASGDWAPVASSAGLAAVLDWRTPPGGSASQYVVEWVATHDRWFFDPASGRLASIVFASGESLVFDWSDDPATSAARELLEVTNLDTGASLRWEDTSSPRDGLADEVIAGDGRTVNYFYATEGTASTTDDNLAQVTVPHLDPPGGEPWGTGSPCGATPACWSYASVDERTPAATRYPWLTSVTDPAGEVVLENSYDSGAPVAFTLPSGWDKNADSFTLTVDGVTLGPFAHVGGSQVVVQDAIDDVVPGTTVGRSGRTYTVFWPLRSRPASFTAAATAGTVTTSVVMDDVRATAPRVVEQATAAGDTITFGYDRMSTRVEVAASGGSMDWEVNGEALAVPVAWNESVAGLEGLLDDVVADVGVEGVPATITTAGWYEISWGEAGLEHLEIDDVGLSGTVNADTRVDTEVTYTSVESTEVVVYHHDLLGRLVGVSDPAGNSTAQAHVASGVATGQVSSFVDRQGGVWGVGWDAAGRPTQRSRPDPDGTGPGLGVDEFVEYDTDGRLTNMVGPGGRTTSYGYDVAVTDRNDPRFWVPVTVRACGVQPDGSDAGAVPDPCPSLIAPTTVTVDADGLVTGVVEPPDQDAGSPVVWSYVYDDPGVGHVMDDSTATGCGARQLCSVSVDGDVTEYTYWPDGSAGAGAVASVTDGAGATSEYYYNVDGTVREVRGPLFDGVSHHARVFGYDAAGRVVWVSDESNPDVDGPGGGVSPTVEYRYGPGGEVEREIEYLDHTRTCPVAASGDPRSAADRCTVTRYRYNGAGQLVAVTRADDGDDMVGSAETDAPAEATTSYTFGILGRVTKVVDPTGVETHSCHDVDGNVVRTIVGSGTPACVGVVSGAFEVSATAYDGWGRVVCEVDPTDVVVWAADGSPDCGAAGTVGEDVYGYDAAGAVTSVVRARGTSAEASSTNVYDGLGRLFQRVESRGLGATAWEGVVEERSYWPSGRLATVTTPPNDVVSWDWVNDVGCMDPTVAPCPLVAGSELVTSYTYDGVGRVATVTDPAGRVTATTYDGAGRVASVTAAAGTSVASVTDYDHDAAGRVVEVSVPSPTGVGTVTQARGWDPVGRLVSETDFAVDPEAVGTPTRSFHYNDAGWLVAATDPNLVWGERVRYGHDLRGNRTSRVSHRSDSDDTAADDYVEVWEYDRADRLTSATDAAGNEAVYAYDMAAGSGVVAGRLWRSVDAAGRTATYSYVAGRVDEVAHAQSGVASITVGYGYDALGRRVETSVGSKTATTVFDSAGRVVSETDGDGAVVSRVWDINGSVRYGIHPGGRQSLFSHDAAGGLVSASVLLASVWVPVSDLQRDARGRVTRELGCCGNLSVNRHWTYNTAGKAVDYTQCWRSWFGACWTNPPPPGGGDPFYRPFVAESIVGWRPDGRVGRVCVDDTNNGACADPAPAGHDFVVASDISYVYDPAGQLVGMGNDCELSGGAPTSACTTTWSYDLGGHRTSHDPDTTVAGDVDYAVDAGGRVVGAGDGCALDAGGSPNGSCSTTYSYDLSGRRVARGGSDAVSYGYDARGRLTTIDGTVEDFSLGYDTDDLSDLTYPTTSGSTTAALVWDHARGVPQIVAFGVARVDYGDQRTSYVTAAGDWDYGYDWAANTTRSPDWGGVPDEYGNVDTYGAATYDPYGNPLDATADTATAEFGYRSELHLGDLIYLRNRTYDPTTGTFISPDPIDGTPGTPDEANPYDYVGNDPLNFTDPLGLCRTTDVEFQIPGDSGADVTVISGPHGGYSYEQCKNSSAVDCSSPTPIVEGDAYIPTGNASVWCRPHVSGNGGKWNWTRPGSGPGCLQWDFWTCDMTDPYNFAGGFITCWSGGLATLEGTDWGTDEAVGGCSGGIVALFGIPLFTSRGTGAAATTDSLFARLEQNGVRYTRSDVVAIGESTSGRVVFLESGTESAGLRHILSRHGSDFARAGISEAEVPGLLIEATTRGRVVGMQGTRPVYEVDWGGQTVRVAVTVGDNGFIVGANPSG